MNNQKFSLLFHFHAGIYLMDDYKDTPNFSPTLDIDAPTLKKNTSLQKEIQSMKLEKSIQGVLDSNDTIKKPKQRSQSPQKVASISAIEYNDTLKKPLQFKPNNNDCSNNNSSQTSSWESSINGQEENAATISKASRLKKPSFVDLHQMEKK